MAEKLPISHIKILLATDSSIETDELKDQLINKGFIVHFARDGKSALEAYTRFQPNLVIISDELPIYDGFELTEKIRSQVEEQHFIPFIMLSNLNSLPLYELEAHHIDEYFISPFDADAVIHKINALSRYQTQYNHIAHKYQRLNTKYHRLQYEYDAAERCFVKVQPRHLVKYNDIQYHMSPQSLSNGDVLFYETSPNGERYIILGDFTGHGLSAAISASTIKELFDKMVKESHELNMIINEMNDLLINILPPEIYAVICAVKIDPADNIAEIWNGGMPTVYIFNVNGIQGVVDSQNPALGIEELTDDELETIKIPINTDDRIFLTTDGLLESRNKHNEMFGRERYLQCITNNIQTNSVFDAVTREVHLHLEGMLQPDDLTFVEIQC